MEKFSQEWFENEFVEMLKLMEPSNPEDEDCVAHLIAFYVPFLCGKYQVDVEELTEPVINFIDNTHEEFFYKVAKEAVR